MTETRVGLLGAGYIAGWHAEAIAVTCGARLVAVADPARGAAQALASAHGAVAFDTLETMLAQAGLDALHVLTPPALHRAHAELALGAGLHVLVEKPFALTSGDCGAMAEAARSVGKLLAVNHNFLAQPGWRKLRAMLADGVPGKIDAADIVWRYPLAPIRSGPFALWMLRSPENLLLELAPHLVAFAVDLFGPIEVRHVETAKFVALPGGARLPQSFRVLAKARDNIELTLVISLVEGAEDRSVRLRGVSAEMNYDFGADVLVARRPNASDIVVNPLRQQLELAGAHLREGLRNAARQAISLNRRQPYALGFLGVSEAFHAAVQGRAALPEALSAASAEAVMTGVEEIIAALPAPLATTQRARVPAPPASAPVAVVIGGTGFIGRALVTALVASGQAVRVISRSAHNPFAELGPAVTLHGAPTSDRVALTEAMRGADCVFHLAKATESTWDGYLRNDVTPTEAIAEAALAAAVRRFVYTGTIASYDASDPARVITEETGFGTDADMARRNHYARSKALCEARLIALAQTRGLPLVIARPGIVLGAGGPLQHWGIGRWHGAGAVRIWGTGRNTLPFVLVEDVADALVRIAAAAGIDGQSFNLVGPPLMSGRDYFDAIRSATGTRIRVASGNLMLFWLGDLLKYLLKRVVLRRGGMVRATLSDWRSRAHLSRFDNQHAIATLGWRPEADRERLIKRATDDLSFFGF